MNALDALVFPNISDTIAPKIEKVILFDENWREIETAGSNQRIKLVGKTRIVASAFDQMNGNGGSRKLGVYRLGFQILRADKTPVSDVVWTISFDYLPDEEAVKLVYAEGSQSGYTPQTFFNYIVSNKVGPFRSNLCCRRKFRSRAKPKIFSLCRNRFQHKARIFRRQFAPFAF